MLSLTNKIRIMEKVKLIPGYYEWHLMKDGDILLNITDSDIEDCVDYSDFEAKIDDIFEAANVAHENNELFNGISMGRIELKDCWKPIIVNTLATYYGCDCDVQSVSKFRKAVLDAGFCLENLDEAGWCDLYRIASKCIMPV